VKDTSIPNANKMFNRIEYFSGKLIANYADDKTFKGEMYELNDGIWSPFHPEINYVSDMTTNSNKLVITSYGEVLVYDQSLVMVGYIKEYDFADYKVSPIQTSCAVVDEQNIVWVADPANGLIKVGTKAERIVPEGPDDNMIFSLTMNGTDLWIASGGRDNAWNNLNYLPKFQLNSQGNWSVFDNKVFPNTNDFRDMICVTIDPRDPAHVFAGSWGGGVLEFNAGKFVKRYDNFNSTLQTQLPDQPSSAYVRIGGIAFDSKNNLWVTNSGVAQVISEYKTDGTWKAYSLPEIANKYSIGKVVVTKIDDKWIHVYRNGLYVLNSTNDQAKAQPVVARFVNSEGEFFTEMNDVYSMVEDRDGEIWVGTSGGVAVFSNPQSIWTEDVMYATRPSLDEHDQIFHPLLEKETVTAIAVDGANRKWFGTKNSGVYLISENGENEIKHFTSQNSPLPSDAIADIAINQKTGEVFIGTAAGLISYMGEATAGNDEFKDVYVYPNPVRESYDGPIVVSGLVENTDVKITDITGDLVFKTTSLGGQAIWDGRNQNNNRCKTGVYLVFMTDPTGEKTKIAKLLFIH
jgi:streptogramin lyase